MVLKAGKSRCMTPVSVWLPWKVLCNFNSWEESGQAGIGTEGQLYLITTFSVTNCPGPVTTRIPSHKKAITVSRGSAHKHPSPNTANQGIKPQCEF